ncbi:MAG: PRC-barrel domain-containing protein [Rhizobiales bacterium]|nr:PRC-barrel domain-containing protein [Hyphomicrobiales bacterium]MBO6700385.1 PRC-barrel domain-containing protein [Hyphomicrobiales bacterium]MBO6737921.1 PRC-barrel domain-containing protein [Hyphomicrobiales bacterium]MBO6913772.1 PRC-barrel domain-containing protein [Hyphomicrobiales bacterium]MBO6954333.1 PRC-barrel domain-containing protein [Hyphomicrobiales bacterium]
MKQLLATTAIVAALGSTAYADDHMSTALLDYQVQSETDLAASDLIGMRIYASENDMETGTTINVGDNQEWDDLGEINDLFVTRDGEVAAVILGIGGFLGIGERDVAVDMSEIRFVNEDGENGEFFLVINASQAELENAPAFERHDSAANQMEDGMAATETPMNADAETDRMRERFTTPVVERDGYVEAGRAELTTEMMTGARVYDTNDADIGEVSQLMVSDDGMIDNVIIDVGGFLGLGEKPIAVSFDELRILRTDDGTDIRVYIDATESQLEEQPAFSG